MQAAFIPSTESEDDTSYFSSRHAWNASDVQIHASADDFDDASDTSSTYGSPCGDEEYEDVG